MNQAKALITLLYLAVWFFPVALIIGLPVMGVIRFQDVVVHRIRDSSLSFPIFMVGVAGSCLFLWLARRSYEKIPAKESRCLTIWSPVFVAFENAFSSPTLLLVAISILFLAVAAFIVTAMFFY
ncbi:MAG: hypothetical protein A2X94_13195 [Bdellovibrionales bacterium GWB1_55_8]|nr:MAG: hypothetical protein A2X94_13195 [Bdellovibrionales bacterium GWB1_55_8]